jgi:hypothetical protein
MKDGVLGAMVPVRPQQVTQLSMKRRMQYAWYQKEVNLLERQLVGPFNFAAITPHQSEQFRIPNMKWTRLREWKDEVDVADVDLVVPVE